MSKKKRKTRREKENIKSHQFINQKTVTVRKESINERPEGRNSEVTLKKTNIPPYVMKDFRKVILITSIVIGFTLLMWILVYQTNIFNFVFDKLNIKY
ncbi:MAG: hypothetical protein WCI63_01700 [bacterium]